MQTSSSFTLSIFIVALLAISFDSTFAHSQMRCAKYDIATGTCYAPIRNQGPSFDQEANDMTSGGGICQSPMSNPISASYSNGAACPDYSPCPLPMGTYKQGENFTVMWIARNHATADQTPGNIALYLSPVESETQGMDVSTTVFAQNKFCEAPFMSCNGQNGNTVQCYATCQMPVNAAVGIHTIWWKWVWNGHTSIYTTCADVFVTAASGNGNTPVPTPTPTPTPVPTVVTTGSVVPSTTASPKPIAATTALPKPSTTAQVKPMTTGQVKPMTTGSPVPSTTAQVKPMTTGSVVPVNPPSGNCAGASVASTSTAYFNALDAWGTQFHAVININVAENVLSNWILEVKWPASSSIGVERYFNAGALQCEVNSASYFRPAYSWSNNVNSGAVLTIEFIANNPLKLDAQTILANTQVRVLKQ